MTNVKNTLFIFSDEHTRDITGCYGDPLVKTPNLDRLAARGVRFDNAYTNCPICVPARASLATGRYVHDNKSWDNAHPYTGMPEAWGHVLKRAGHEVVATGKLHMRDSETDNGHSLEIETLHVVDGIGDIAGCNRDELVERGSAKTMARDAGAGNSTYSAYDARTTDNAIAWLRENGTETGGKPWVLYAGLTLPHFPLICPQEFYDLYDGVDLPAPRFNAEDAQPNHPYLRKLRETIAYDKYFDEERRRVAIQAYYGMVSYLDHQIGRMLSTLEELGQLENTLILYSSDHGEMLGNRGYWGKSVFFEESAAIPMILAGPGVPEGAVVKTPVSLVDVHPTMLEACGMPPEAGLPGRSLFGFIAKEDPDRAVFGEYHAIGACTGAFMLRWRNWKYTYYVGFAPQLFDLDTDPDELIDLAPDAAHAPTLEACEARLRQIVDPEAVSAEAFESQRAKIADFGGMEAVLARGDFPHTPAPGEKAEFTPR